MNTSTRPVSIPHLVFGLIFTGGALVWLIGEATDADLPHSAIGFPAVLIGAGLAGLIGSLVNARNRNRAAVADQLEVAGAADHEAADVELPDDESVEHEVADHESTDETTEATTVITEENR